MKCPKCQAENAETSRFCADCGTRIRGHVLDSQESGTPLQNSKDIRPEVTETLQTPIQELTTGSTFAGRYQVIEELGHGGMGRVYKVFDSKIKDKVALKLKLIRRKSISCGAEHDRLLRRNPRCPMPSIRSLFLSCCSA